jgi:hypothetical protein
MSIHRNKMQLERWEEVRMEENKQTEKKENAALDDRSSPAFAEPFFHSHHPAGGRSDHRSAQSVETPRTPAATNLQTPKLGG